jgi:MFS family permease
MKLPEDGEIAARAPQPAVRHGLRNLLTFLVPTALALYANFQGVQQILAPVQVEAIDAKHKIANLAALTVFCSVTGVAGLMMGGAVSDATRTRWGRREPWLAAMAAASAALALLMGAQRNLLAIGAAYGALWFTLNFFQGAMLAIVPDRVASSRRGLASAVMGVGGPLGSLVGVNLAALLPGPLGYAVLAAMLAATTLAFLAFARDVDLRETTAARIVNRSPPRRLGFAAVLRTLHGFRSRDFSTAFGLRVLMFVTQFSINNYLLYILQDHIGVAHLPGHNAQVAAGVLNSLRTLVTLAAIFVAGWFAQRTEKRRDFVRLYAACMAVAMLVPIIFPTWPGMIAFGLIGGLAMGVYSAIDLALMSHVLPDRAAAGRDLAILVMAGAAAQFLAPILGGGFIKLLGYDALFLFCAAGTLGVGALTYLLRSVR